MDIRKHKINREYLLINLTDNMSDPRCNKPNYDLTLLEAGKFILEDFH